MILRSIGLSAALAALLAACASAPPEGPPGGPRGHGGPPGEGPGPMTGPQLFIIPAGEPLRAPSGVPYPVLGGDSTAADTHHEGRSEPAHKARWPDPLVGSLLGWSRV